MKLSRNSLNMYNMQKSTSPVNYQACFAVEVFKFIHSKHLFTNELIVLAFFISTGMIFQINTLEYDKLYLNVFS